MYTSDLSDVEEKKTKKTNHISEMKRKVIGLSNNSSDQPGSLADFAKKAKLAIYTSVLSDVKEKKTKTKNRHINETKDIDESSESSLFDDSDIDKDYVLPKDHLLNYDSENDGQNDDTKLTLNQQDEYKKSSTLNITPISEKYTIPKRVYQNVDAQNVLPSTSHQEADTQNTTYPSTNYNIQSSYLINNDLTKTQIYESSLVNCNEQNLNFQKLILKYLTSLKVEVSNISETQQEIIKMVNDIQNKPTSQADKSWALEFDYFVSNWPISNQDGLNDMENKIKTDSNFRKQVVSELARIGGKSLQNMIYKILKRVFDDTILLEFTYYGLRKKDNFSLLAINKVIFEAVLKSKFSNHSNDDIITAISKWLTGAKGRLLSKKEK